MDIKNKNIIKIALVFVGNVIGAGFATGSELSGFFVRYGYFGAFGLALSCFLFSVICYIVLAKISITRACNFVEYFPNMSHKVTNVMNFIVSAFLWSSLCVMYSAGGAVFSYAFNTDSFYGAMAVCLVCMAVIWGGAERFVRVNSFITPVMVVGLLLVGFSAIVPTFGYGDVHKFASPVLYTSYNTITAVAVMTAVSDLVTTKDIAKRAAITAGGIMLVVSAVLWTALYFYGDLRMSIPMLSVIDGKFVHIYCTVLFMAILTTATSNGIAALNSAGLKKKRYLPLLLVPVAFSQSQELNALVMRVYSFFGAVGFIIMLVTFVDGYKILRKTKKTREIKRIYCDKWK